MHYWSCARSHISHPTHLVTMAERVCVFMRSRALCCYCLGKFGLVGMSSHTHTHWNQFDKNTLWALGAVRESLSLLEGLRRDDDNNVDDTIRKIGTIMHEHGRALFGRACATCSCVCVRWQRSSHCDDVISMCVHIDIYTPITHSFRVSAALVANRRIRKHGVVGVVFTASKNNRTAAKYLRANIDGWDGGWILVCWLLTTTRARARK